jgi:pimeloyl-ACP methyl ester carboxylesterase
MNRLQFSRHDGSVAAVPKIDANNLKFHYWVSGQGPNVVVLVHGLGGNLAGWHLTIVPELQREYRVLTYDLRGHGRSDAPPAGYTTGDMARDLKGILDALDIEKAAIVGHSWGADIVLHFALLNPERVSELVIIEGALLAPLASIYRRQEWDGWIYVTDTIEKLLGRPIAEENRCDLEYLLRQLIEIPIIYGPVPGRPRDEEIVFRVLDILRPMWQGREADGNIGLESLSRIEHATLLVYESNSVFLEAHRELSERLPASSSTMLPGGAKLKHFSSLEHPELILANTRNFLRAPRAGLLDASRAS